MSQPTQCPHIATGENGVAERWNRTLKKQAIHGRIFQNLEAVRAAVADFVEWYNQTWLRLLATIGGIPFTQVPTTGCGGVSSSDHGYP